MKKIAIALSIGWLFFICFSGYAQKADKKGWKLGVQAYTFRVYTLVEAAQKAESLGLKYIELYNGQRLGEGFGADEKVDFLKMDKESGKKVKKMLKDHGLTVTAMGVFSPRGKKDWITTFEFAKAMKIGVINSEPAPEDMAVVDELATKYKIKVAIHNHPKPSRYWDPQVVLDAVKPCGKYVGVCADAGHWVRSGLDPIECIKQLNGKIFSLHFKDLNAKDPNAHDVPWGTGVCNVEGILAELKNQKFKGPISIEYEYNWTTSVPEIQESVNYFNRVTDRIL